MKSVADNASTSRSGRPPELLAPAGDWDALRAGVANGADAIYFGLERFNARLRAANFTLAELPDRMAYLHDHNVRGYVTVNTLIYPDELPQAEPYVVALAEAGVDAVIVQDLGLLRLIRRLVPTLPVHASTQMTQTEAGGLTLLQSLGVRRAIIARELSLAEIARLASATTMELEVFVHGALCISYSGQCLASEMLLGRSANRGQCAQVCRLPYELVVDGQPQPAGGRDYPLSAQDLAVWDRVRELTGLGVAGFKIEGRLKSAQYVAAATRVYRAAIDAAVAGQPFELSAADAADLAQSFSRGFTHGFLDGVNHAGLVHGKYGKKRGVAVGRVAGRTRRGVLVTLEEPDSLKPGDGVVFDAGDPQQDEQGGRIYSVERAAGRATAGGKTRTVELTFGQGDLDLAAIRDGCVVWKTDDPAIRRRLEQSFNRDIVVRRTMLDVRVVAAVGQPLRVWAHEAGGVEVELCSEQPLAAAQRHPLTVELLREQFGRLGDTPYALGRVELSGPDGSAESVPVLAPKSVLNDLRRRVVEQLRAQRVTVGRHAVSVSGALAELRAAGQPTDVVETSELSVLVRTQGQLEAVLVWTPSPEVVYCELPEMKDLRPAVELCRSAGRSVGLATPRVLMPGEEQVLEGLAELSPDCVLVRNLAAVAYLRAKHPQLPLVGDATLNVANDLTTAALLEQGVTRLTPAVELDTGRLVALSQVWTPNAFEVVLHQHVALMHTRHCLWAAASQSTACSDCGRPCRGHTLHLRDRNGLDHPVLTDVLGRTTVFQAAAKSMLGDLPRLAAADYRRFRIELLDETPDGARQVLEQYAQRLA